LTHVSDLLTQLQGVDLTTLPGVGAAGGLAYALRQLPRSSLISGSQWLADILGLSEKLRQADLIITGEGRFDSTSLAGKATGMLLALADQKPVVIFCGQAEPGLTFAQGIEIFPLAETPEASAAAMAKPKLALRKQVAVAAPMLQSLLSSGLPKPAW
jgi:glycerate kinase